MGLQQAIGRELEDDALNSQSFGGKQNVTLLIAPTCCAKPDRQLASC